jgi:Trypsin-like peptidase domain
MVADSDEAVSVGTGFVCFDQEHVVTAYHLLVNARRFNLYYEKAGKRSAAQMEKILKQADLALLRVSCPEAAPLPIATGRAEPGSQVLSLGYAYGAQKVDSLTMNKIRETGGKYLGEILNAENLRQILDSPAFRRRC